VAALEQDAQLAPNHLEARYLLARAYRKLGRAEEARQEMNLYQKLAEAQRAPK
jgi:Flp pilus assembly protein TadD